VPNGSSKVIEGLEHAQEIEEIFNLPFTNARATISFLDAAAFKNHCGAQEKSGLLELTTV